VKYQSDRNNEILGKTCRPFNNSWSEEIPEKSWEYPTKELNLSSNNLTGRIPNSIGKTSKLETLGLLKINVRFYSGRIGKIG